MLYIKNIEEGLPVFKALSSELRIQIVKILLENSDMSMREIAQRLNITNGALTSHIKLLEEGGIVRVLSASEVSGHGNQKVCRINLNRILIDVNVDEAKENNKFYEIDIPIGQYADYEIHPSCGISTEKNIIGEVDDTRYFAHPERSNAKIIWFAQGYVEYIIPNLTPALSQIDQITLSMEIASEAPSVNNDWPSDISFLLNDELIGTWTSPGDYGDVRGIFTPDWWLSNWNQYGLLKILVINKQGTFIDGMKISDLKITHFDFDNKSMIKFKFMVREDAKNMGGFTLFGRDFGNYNQDLKVKISYS